MSDRDNDNDVRFENYGTIVLIRPLSEMGGQWIDQHIETQPWMWYCGAVSRASWTRGGACLARAADV